MARHTKPRHTKRQNRALRFEGISEFYCKGWLVTRVQNAVGARLKSEDRPVFVFCLKCPCVYSTVGKETLSSTEGTENFAAVLRLLPGTELDG